MNLADYVVEKYSPDQPRDDHGRFGEGAPEPVVGIISARAQRAMESYVPAKADKQRVADAQESIISRAIGIPRTRDNSAFDLRNAKVGIEVKTMQDSKNAKITMSKTALARKVSEVRASARSFRAFTLVADKRSGGGGTRYYIKEGLGSFRVGSMTPVSLAEIRRMVA